METNGKELPNINGQDVPRQDWQDHLTGHHLRKGSWRRIHHSWIFWVFLILMLGAISYYISSVDFAFAPRPETHTPEQNRTTP
ncbi:MAG: hypothetical protein WCL06_09600 [Bacteroidota bacterium]